MKVTGPEFHPGPIPGLSNHEDHDDGSSEDLGDGSIELNGRNFNRYSHLYKIFVVKFYAPWCFWSARLKPSWEKAAKIMRERYDPEMDRRILLGKVDCTAEVDLCRRHHIQGYPSIRIFRKGNDLRDYCGHHQHESYYGYRDTDSLVAAMEALVASIPTESKLALEDKSGSSNETRRPAPKTGACRIEGFVLVKKNAGSFLHGGVTAAYVDIIDSAAIFTTGAESSGFSVEINVSYLAAAKLGEEIEIEAKVLRIGKSIAIVNVDLRKKKTGELSAQGRHTKYLTVTSKL